MALYDSVANLFKTAKPQNVAPSPNLGVSEDAKLQGETYVYYGTRICGKVTASLSVLSPFLQRVYNLEKQRQIADEQLQQTHRQELAKRIEEVNGKIVNTNAEVEKSEHKIADIIDAISDLKEKLIEAKDKNGEVNKMAKVKLVIGLVILAILTLYLFVFYSSTFYSAFFKQFDANITIGAAMFDSQAIPHALNDGLGELVFILCAPIIFMGLGYGLHFFMLQESWTKYVKTGSVLLITFVFDCILAYLIAEKIYNIQSLMTLSTMPPFSIEIAAHDVNVWAVIFCGFIVYLIWGIVFDMAMTAYEDLRSNRKEILRLENEIQSKKDAVSSEKSTITSNKAKLQDLENRKQALMNEMSQTVHFDPQIIKTALADFFSGWMTMMGALSKPTNEQNKANEIYGSTIQQLF